jgi:hypothetical protein
MYRTKEGCDMELTNVVSTDRLLGVGAAAVGMVGAGLLTQVVPFGSTNAKAGVVLVVGLLVAGLTSGPVRLAGIGMSAAAAVQLARANALITI